MLIPVDRERAALGYADYFAPRARELTKRLKHAGISPNVSSAIFESGYILWEDRLPAYKTGTLTPVVHDGFYGTKWGYGFIPLTEFIECARLGQALPVNKWIAPTYTVSSTEEIENILRSERHRPFVENGRMCFRGQTREYFISRPFPNPRKKNAEGRERLIVPTYWRKFVADYNRRPFRNDPVPVVSSVCAGDMIFQGIENWQLLEARRKTQFPKLDGLIGILESQNPLALQNFLRDAPECRDIQNLPKRISDAQFSLYCERWIDHVLMASIGDEPVLLEQHYGLSTCGLDVTYDAGVATFFATNKFFQKDKAQNVGDFKMVSAGTHEGVIYCFVFEDPPAYRTSEVVSKLKLFQHCQPIRPLRQQCALPYFHAENFNEAAVELDAVFYLGKDFVGKGVPQKNEIFPATHQSRRLRKFVSLPRIVS